MDFRLDERLLLVRDTARALARERIAPRAREIDLSEQYPEDIFQLFREQGLLGLAVPEAEGGAGAGVLALTLAVEEVAWACASSAKILALSLFYTWPLLAAGSRAQREAYLRPAAAGELRGAFALTEPNAGSDLGSMVARAERRAGGYLLNGEKLFISGGPQAGYFVFFAKVGPLEGTAGLTAFILPTASPHLFMLRQDRGMGVRGVPHPDYAVQDYLLPESQRLGAEGQGYEIARRTFNAMQPVTAARGLGLAERCLSYALDYSLSRQLYGAPLSQLGVIRARLAQMCIEIEAARLLTYQAAWLVDQGQDGPEAEAYLSAAKTFASETVVRVAAEAMEVLGGHGYMTEHPVERWYRDARQLVHYALTNDIHRETIARALLDRRLSY
jgi:alkylation response protein AidB-like acyl-CoA dehydrogenase